MTATEKDLGKLVVARHINGKLRCAGRILYYDYAHSFCRIQTMSGDIEWPADQCEVIAEEDVATTLFPPAEGKK